MKTWSLKVVDNMSRIKSPQLNHWINVDYKLYHFICEAETVRSIDINLMQTFDSSSIHNGKVCHDLWKVMKILDRVPEPDI